MAKNSEFSALSEIRLYFAEAERAREGFVEVS
jgi:hypothetical protein